MIAAVLATLLSSPLGAPAAPELLIKLRVRIAQCPATLGGAPQATRSIAWVNLHVNAARDLLAPRDITLTSVAEPFTPSRCELLTRSDRDALAREVNMDGAVTVLVVPRVRDLAVLTYDLKGVHWKAGGRRWIYLTASANPPVLAHELAHYFGLPHDPSGGNLMTPGPSSPAWKSKHPPAPFAPILTGPQIQRLRAGIESHLRNHAK